jgi:hypothetical protein
VPAAPCAPAVPIIDLIDDKSASGNASKDLLVDVLFGSSYTMYLLIVLPPESVSVTIQESLPSPCRLYVNVVGIMFSFYLILLNY